MHRKSISSELNQCDVLNLNSSECIPMMILRTSYWTVLGISRSQRSPKTEQTISIRSSSFLLRGIPENRKTWRKKMTAVNSSKKEKDICGTWKIVVQNVLCIKNQFSVIIIWKKKMLKNRERNKNSVKRTKMNWNIRVSKFMNFIS